MVDQKMEKKHAGNIAYRSVLIYVVLSHYHKLKVLVQVIKNPDLTIF
jgi:hypothetical protein